jgi:hypothetical protein
VSCGEGIGEGLSRVIEPAIAIIEKSVAVACGMGNRAIAILRIKASTLPCGASVWLPFTFNVQQYRTPCNPSFGNVSAFGSAQDYADKLCSTSDKNRLFSKDYRYCSSYCDVAALKLPNFSDVGLTCGIERIREPENLSDLKGLNPTLHARSPKMTVQVSPGDLVPAEPISSRQGQRRHPTLLSLPCPSSQGRS